MIEYPAPTMKNREDHRTSVSLAEVVWKLAEEMMEARGFNDNFSAYVADLIRRDRELHEARSKPRAVYPGASSHLSEFHDALPAAAPVARKKRTAR